jgi:hypothetical protein
MVVAVVITNMLLATLFFYVAWRLWKLSRVIDRAAKAVLNADRVTYNVLHASPQAIARGELGTRNLRKRYQQVELQLLRLRQIIALLNRGRITWLGRSLMSRRPKREKGKRETQERENPR